GQNQKLRLSVNRMLAHCGVTGDLAIEWMMINQILAAINHQPQINSKRTMHTMPLK
ncbi:MAG: hypothetical protein GY847_16840, partial [Proteobacteria bacterium]|nr:hypothetical protein [Pseudomonadota bacterium]